MAVGRRRAGPEWEPALHRAVAMAATETPVARLVANYFRFAATHS